MENKKVSNNICYVIQLGNSYCYICKDVWSNNDNDIAEWLDLELEEYINILRKFNAIEIKNEYYFKNKKDCEKCIEFLELRIILKLLTE